MSELGNLSQCMVDSDAASKTGAKRMRHRAVALSIILEAGAIGGLVLWPLLTVAVLPSQALLTPLPPYHGIGETRPVVQRPHAIHDGSAAYHTNLRQLPRIPRNVDSTPGAAPLDIDAGGPASPGIPGGFDERPVEIIPPPQPPAQNRTVVRSAQVMEAMLVHRVQPEYPRLAITTHTSGTVVLRATIGTDGQIRNLEVLSGNALLAQAAREAVMQWRYRPTTLNGQPVEVETQVTVNFILN